MRIETEDAAPGVTRAKLIGRMDVAGAMAVDLSFNVLVGAERALIVDLSGVDFVASMGLRTLIMGARTVASKQGRMVFLNPGPDVEKVLLASGANQLAPIFHDLDDAIRAVAG